MLCVSNGAFYPFLSCKAAFPLLLSVKHPHQPSQLLRSALFSFFSPAFLLTACLLLRVSRKAGERESEDRLHSASAHLSWPLIHAFSIRAWILLFFLSFSLTFSLSPFPLHLLPFTPSLQVLLLISSQFLLKRGRRQWTVTCPHQLGLRERGKEKSEIHINYLREYARSAVNQIGSDHPTHSFILIIIHWEQRKNGVKVTVDSPPAASSSSLLWKKWRTIHITLSFLFQGISLFSPSLFLCFPFHSAFYSQSFFLRQPNSSPSFALHQLKSEIE